MSDTIRVLIGGASERDVAAELTDTLKQYIKEGWTIHVESSSLNAQPSTVLHQIVLNPPYPSERPSYASHIMTGEHL